MPDYQKLSIYQRQQAEVSPESLGENDQDPTR